MSNSTFSRVAVRQPATHASNYALSMNVPSSRWKDAVYAKLTELRELPYGWDGYQGIPISSENAHFAAQLLVQICGLHTPAPSIVPGSRGDLQIEWHTAHGDLELHILKPYQVEAFVSVAGSDDDEELLLNRDFSNVARWLLEITEGANAIPAAA